MKKINIFLILLPLITISQNFENIIQNYLTINKDQFQLSSSDLSDFVVHNQHFSKSTKTYNVYVTQKVSNIEIHQAVSVFSIDNAQKVRTAKIKFISQASQKINTNTPSLTPLQAISKAADYLKISDRGHLQLIDQINEQQFLFNATNISQESIPVKLMYQSNTDQTQLRLVWDMSIYLLDSSHWYSIKIDALNGEMVNIIDWVSNCKFDNIQTNSHHKSTVKAFGKQITLNQSLDFVIGPNDGSQYNVLPIPNESPNHGTTALISEPANSLASPFGWHDTNGSIGPEFTSTRGNNVRARADLAGNNTGEEAQGGSTLNFNFPYSLNDHPNTYILASTTNLFYWNNIIHDVFHFYGFDEASGNFQQINYSGQGLGNDFVNADNQDGSGTNNANFAAPPDGNSPRMQMFNWTVGSGGVLLSVPFGVLQGTYSVVPSTFGSNLSTPVTGNFVLLLDDDSGTITDPNDGCDNITNGANLSGKIVVIKRGNCQFGTKILAAQNLGAIAVIIVNNSAATPIAMGPGNDGGSVTIPSVMITQALGQQIIDALNNNQSINGTLSLTNDPVLTSSMDSGVITHEYGHGISNRLTGGANISNCLSNAEQMGEGWSDYFALMLTMKPTDTADQIRGMGSYLRNQPITGNGIRPAPYSRNFGVNNFTFDATNSQNISQPHGIGFVWASMLWDMTWDMIDFYGFNTNFYSGNGGNNKALQLVVDGLKLQPCNPGFVDGRNAILEADLLANNSDNKCLIWRAFARRGLGLGASQGSSNNRFDQIEAFDIPEECALSSSSYNSADFYFYPNPTDGQLQIVSKNAIGLSTISVFDINGRMVKKASSDITNHSTFDISDLTSGVYMIEISNGTIVYQTKIIKK